MFILWGYDVICCIFFMVLILPLSANDNHIAWSCLKGGKSQHRKSNATQGLDQVKIQLNPAITSSLGKQLQIIYNRKSNPMEIVLSSK